MAIPIQVTSHTVTIPGHPGAIGPEAALQAAVAADSQITLSGRWAGERVYLGQERQTYGDSGITVETVGVDRRMGQGAKYPGVDIAVYLIDTSRLEDAPRLARHIADVESRRLAAAMAAEQRAQAAEDRYLNNEEI